MNKYDYSSNNTSDSEEYNEEYNEEPGEEPGEESGEEPGEGEKYCMCSCGDMICRNICLIDDIICRECTYSNNFYILENRETHFRIEYTHLSLELIECYGSSSASLLLEELARDYVEFKYLFKNHSAIAIQVIQNELNILYS